MTNHSDSSPGPSGGSTAPPDPQAGPFNTRGEAEVAFGHVRRGAEAVTEFNAQYLADSIDSHQGVTLGRYDQLVIHRIAAMFDTTDVAVIASWAHRAAGTVTDPDEHEVADPEAGR